MNGQEKKILSNAHDVKDMIGKNKYRR